MTFQSDVLVAGIDAGSNTVKVVLLDGTNRMSFRITKTGSNSVKTARETLDRFLREAGIDGHGPDYLVATGYGRNYIDFADRSATEILCHARGVRHFIPQARTIIDIGGQDSKVIYLNAQGKIKDFLMNDKCAAGTGRFLEVTAGALDIGLERMGDVSLQARNEVSISSTCTVFAESEVVSHVARGEMPPDIVAGIHRSIVTRVLGMAQRKPIITPLVVTGGVAKNRGVIRIIREELGHEVMIPEEPQITGALGAALLALDNVSAGRTENPPRLWDKQAACAALVPHSQPG